MDPSQPEFVVSSQLERYDAIVVGGGLSGLTVAEGMNRRGLRVLVLEREKRAGGVIRSERRDGFLCEAGPNSFLVKSGRVEEYLADLGLESAILDVDPRAKKRFLVRKGRVVPAPLTPLQAVRTPILSWRGKLAVLREPWQATTHGADDSVAAFVRRRLGSEFLDYLVAPMVSGVFAGDPERLSLRHAFPKVWNLEARHGSLIRGAVALRRERRQSVEAPFRSRLISFREGLETVPRRLAECLGESLLTGAEILALRPLAPNGEWLVEWRRGLVERQAAICRKLIVTAPNHAWLRLPLPQEARIALAALAPVSHPPVATLSLGYRRDQVKHPLDGFGLLVPPVENQPILGTIFASSLFADRAPPGHVLLISFLGGATNPEAGRLAEKEATEATRRALGELLGVRGEPVCCHHVRWDRAIPQYHVDYDRFLEGVAQVEAGFPGLHFQGSFRGGPGLSDVMGNALAMVDRVSAGLNRP